MSALALTVQLPDIVLEELVAQVTQRVLSALKTSPDEGGWIRGATAAAQYIDCPVSRIYALTSQDALPHHKDGSALVFRKAELDAFIEAGGSRRA